MTPPRWLDAAGRARATYPCPRCGRQAPYDQLEFASLRRLKWQLFTAVLVVNWCGHAQESLMLPDVDAG